MRVSAFEVNFALADVICTSKIHMILASNVTFR